MGKSNRIRANRSQNTVTAPIKAKKKQGMPAWVLSAIVILVTVAVLFTVVGSLLSANGVIKRLSVPVSSENYKITGSMMSYFYHSAYQSFDSQYESSMSTFSLDTSKSLKSQTFGDPALGGNEVSYLGEFQGTWYDYFMNLALQNAKRILSYCEEANARGIALNESELAEIDAELDALKTTAEQSGFTLSQYITYTYGQGVKKSDLKKCFELTYLASKGMSAVQEELISGITDDDILAKYNESKDQFDLVDYVYYSTSVKYETVAKELLGSDYTQAELNEKKDEVDTEYASRVEKSKLIIAELEKITDKDAFIKRVLTYNAGDYYDTKYESLDVVEPNAPAAEVLATIKSTMVDKIVAEVLEGKTETSSDVTKEGEQSVLYGHNVHSEFAEAADSIKKEVFKSVLADKTKYEATKVTHSSTSDFSKWAFEDGRTVGEIKTITNADKPEESYSSSVYMLTKTRYADATKTKNIAYMLFENTTDAKGAIAKLEGTELTLDAFKAIATELAVANTAELKEYVEGSYGIPALDEWAFSDTIKVGDYTKDPIEVDADATYLVGYYYEEGPETWKVTVKGEIFNDRYTVKDEEILAKFTIKTKSLNRVSDGYLPANLVHAH